MGVVDLDLAGVERLRRESISDAEVRVDVAPAR
jgi:hypothetical protein